MRQERIKKQAYNIKIEIMYDGTHFNGWQRLGNGKEETTIQGILEQTVLNVTGQKVKLIGSGRTDAGVHAYGQVANFHLNSRIDLNGFRSEMNTMLPKDIQIVSAEYVKESFHSRYDAISKWYEYQISTGDVERVFQRHLSLYVKEKLDIEAMRRAAEYLCGTHDFAGFSSTMADGRPTVKTIYEVQIVKKEEMLVICYHGDGFLYNMVRILTGTLLEVGLGKRKPESIFAIFEKCDRQLAGVTVPGKGLFLKKVVYI